MRTRFKLLRSRLAAASHVILTSPQSILARLAVAEARGLTDGKVEVLRGGTIGWTERGGELVADKTDPPDEACVDYYLKPYDRNSGVEAAMQAYLSWEIDLVREIERDGTVAFGV